MALQSVYRRLPRVPSPATLAHWSRWRRSSSSASSQPLYPGHVRITPFSRAFLAIGSSIMSLVDPRRGDMIAVLSETSAGPSLGQLRDRMLESVGGRRLLRDRPRITKQSVNVEHLASLADGTLGREYVRWLEVNRVTPDTREPVRYINDPELAYVMQRYRECHDFYHLITGPFPVSTPGEIVVKIFELANSGLPVALLSAAFGPLRLPAAERRRLLSTYGPWALRCGSNAVPLIGVEWERLWNVDIVSLKQQLRIMDLPVDWKEFRRAERQIKQVGNRRSW